MSNVAARPLLHGAIFLAAVALGCALIDRLAPFPPVPGLHPKWMHFRENPGRYDTIFVGSSRFNHQIIPKQFDAELARAGMRTTSFNFAYDAMWPPESFYFLRRILALHPPRLRWVFIDLMDINTKLDERNSSTLRMLHWHDAKHTWLALRDICAHGWPPEKRRDLLWRHAQLGIRRIAHLGQGADLLQGLFKPRKSKSRDVAAFAGWEVEPERRMEGKELTAFLAGVAAMKGPLEPAPVRPVFREALAEIIREVRTAGAEPVFVVPPTLNPGENFTGVPSDATVWLFIDPNQYPDLFEPDRHYDAWHLNEKGAIEFTSALAEKFQAWRHSMP